MATADTSSSNKNSYMRYSAEKRERLALEMATEIAEQDRRLFSLASAIRDQLAEELGEDRVCSHAFGLAELLCDLMTDASQSIRLRECLEAMQPAGEVTA